MDKYSLSNIETSALISFMEVAERGSFTEAAIALNLSQPTVSQQVQRLERMVGVKLLHRRSNKVYLSQAGEAFITHCQAGLKNIEAGINTALKTAQNSLGKVTLGLTSFNTKLCLSTVLNRFHRCNPNVCLQIFEYPLEDLIQGLQNQTIDLAWMSSPLPKEILQTEVLYEEPLGLVCAATHALAGVADPTWYEISQYPIVLPHQVSKYGIRSLVEELFRSHQCPVNTVVEFSGSQSLRLILASSDGVAFLPLSQVKTDLRNNALVAKTLPGQSLVHEAVIATNPRFPLSPEATSLLETIRTLVPLSIC